MNAKALKQFIDSTNKCIRNTGEVFELTKKRFDEITSIDDTLVEKAEVENSNPEVGE